MLNVDQFRTWIVRPTLERLALHSEAAEMLLVGTAIQESRLTYLKQLGGGPALGVYQIEPRTHGDLYETYLDYREELRDRVRGFAAARPNEVVPPESELIGNLYYATAVARLIYYRRPEPLPPADNLAAIAAYWKRYYNTAAGAGTADEFVANYRAYAM